MCGLLVELSPLGPLSKRTHCQLLNTDSHDLREKIPVKVIGNSVIASCCLCLYIFECMHEKRSV